MPSQSDQPGSHAAMPQTPFSVQSSTALGKSQTKPQAPQLFTLVNWVSQPSFGLAQSPQRGSQLGMQMPSAHCVLPWAFVQVTPQAPQLASSVERLNPLSITPLQSSSAPLQVSAETSPTVEQVKPVRASLHKTKPPPHAPTPHASPFQVRLLR